MNRNSQLDIVNTLHTIAAAAPAMAGKLPKDLNAKAITQVAEAVSDAIARMSSLNGERKRVTVDKEHQLAEARALLKRVRAAVVVAYGDDSAEYAQVGGKRRSERQARAKKAPAATVAKAA